MGNFIFEIVIFYRKVLNEILFRSLRLLSVRFLRRKMWAFSSSVSILILTGSIASLSFSNVGVLTIPCMCLPKKILIR